ncbi:MAG: DnaJ domain-containing protein [Legionellaceae bacterium]|nr:DnaJ domain-containing protein [Legionellaceae bacterium]
MQTEYDILDTPSNTVMSASQRRMNSLELRDAIERKDDTTPQRGLFDYYEILGLNRYAKSYRIKEVYKRLALIYHPDRGATADEEKFKQISEAYETLNDEHERTKYDEKTYGNISFQDRIKSYHYVLQEHPEQYDRYTFVNKLLALEGGNKLRIGEEISHDIYIKLRDIARDCIYQVDDINPSWEKRRYLAQGGDVPPEKKLNEDEEKRVGLLLLNWDAIYWVTNLYSDEVELPRKKEIYDLSLGVYHTERSKDIERLLGGRNVLVEAVAKNTNRSTHFDLSFVNGLFALYEANILTPNIFKNYRKPPIWGLLDALNDIKYLTQESFDLILAHANNASNLWSLLRAEACTPQNFECVLRAGRHSECVAQLLVGLHQLNLLNDENRQIVIKHRIPPQILPILSDMKDRKELTENMSDTLMWEGSEEIRPLIHAVNDMFAHGLFLLTRDVEKAKIVMCLAIDLKQDLHRFMNLPPTQQIEKAVEFKQNFLQKLHSKDEIMSKHRQYWKVIIANIVIALTGVGLFALGLNYAINGNCFFAKTTREKRIEAIESAANVHLSFSNGDKNEGSTRTPVIRTFEKFRAPCIAFESLMDELAGLQMKPNPREFQISSREVAAVAAVDLPPSGPITPKSNRFAKAFSCLDLGVPKGKFVFLEKYSYLPRISDDKFYSDFQRNVFNTIIKKHNGIVSNWSSSSFWFWSLSRNNKELEDLRDKYARLYDAFEALYPNGNFCFEMSSHQLEEFKKENKIDIDAFDRKLQQFISDIFVLYPSNSYITHAEVKRSSTAAHVEHLSENRL